MIGLAKAFVDVAPGQAVLEQQIRAALFMQNRRAGRQRLGGVEDRRQRLVLDVNLFQRALRRAQVLGRHRRHQLAVETNFVDGDKVLIVDDFQMLMGGRV